jgi:hypothetical protein
MITKIASILVTMLVLFAMSLILIPMFGIIIGLIMEAFK